MMKGAVNVSNDQGVQVQTFYNDRCFSKAPSVKSIVDGSGMKVEYLGMYNAPMYTTIMDLGKFDQNNEKVKALQKWEGRSSWKPSEDILDVTNYVKDCQATTLGRLPEYEVAIRILKFSPFSTAHLIKSTNRTHIGTNLALHVWKAAFHLLHDFPSFVRTEPIQDMFFDLKNIIQVHWASFDYSFSLNFHPMGPRPLLDISVMQVDESKRVAQAIALDIKRDQLQKAFKALSSVILESIGMDVEVENGQTERLVNADVTLAFSALEKVSTLLSHFTML